MALVLLGGATTASPVRSGAAAPVVVAATCATSGPQTPTGSGLISTPMLPAIVGTSLAVDLPVTVVATSEINPGGTVTSTATISLDLDPIAQDVLEHRVRPAVIAAGYPSLAPTAWDVLTLSHARIALRLPAGTSAAATPSASSPSAATTASFDAGTVVLDLAEVRADTRSPSGPVTATLAWQVRDGGAPPPRTLVLHPAGLSFSASVDVGVLFYGSPVIGGVTGPWSCSLDHPGMTLASTAVVSTTVTSGSSLPSSTTTPTGGSTTTTRPGSTTSTTWPSVGPIKPGSCLASGLDRYGGDPSVDLGATGRFRTQQYQGRWWLVDPDGHPFFSQGINNVSFAGTPDRNGATPYEDGVRAKYGTPQAWADEQLRRMQAWGYNTIGAWSDTDLFASRAPYTVLLDMTSQDFATGVMEDLWSPGWAAGVADAVAAQVPARAADPYLLGYWTDNELHWGPDWRPVHLFDEYLDRPAAAPGKQVLLTFLEQRYPSFSAFTADFTTSAASWADLAGPATATARPATGGQATRDAWVGVVAERYFSYTTAAIKAADPTHLVLGPRMIAQVTGTPVLEAAARYVDVASFNDYDIVPELAAPLRNADPTYLPVEGGLAAQEAILHKPILVSEWSYRSADSGLPNTWPPLFPVLATQAQRAAAYETFTQSLLGTSWVVGQHWFEHSDEPPAGRGDGENSNFGLVDLHDRPYEPLVDASRTMHDCAYARLAAGPPSSLPVSSTTVTTPPVVGSPSSSSPPTVLRPTTTPPASSESSTSASTTLSPSTPASSTAAPSTAAPSTAAPSIVAPATAATSIVAPAPTAGPALGVAGQEAATAPPAVPVVGPAPFTG